MANINLCRKRAEQLLAQASQTANPDLRAQLLLRAAHWQDLALHLAWVRAVAYLGDGLRAVSVQELIAAHAAPSA
jgi:hypothetical protein